MTNESMTALLGKVESVIDATQGLTRTHPDGLVELAEFAFRDSEWTVRVNVRNTLARGRGSRVFFPALDRGDSPEAAVANFIERLPIFVRASS